MWITGSTYWYVCKIRKNCANNNEKELAEIKPKNTIIDIKNISKKEISLTDSTQILEKYFSKTTNHKIFFKYSEHKTTFSQKNITHFNKIKKYLKLYPKKKIVINSYTDNKGSSEYNLKLSKLRAKFIKKELLKLGFLDTQIIVLAKGEIKSKNLNSTEKLRTKNRKVEIQLK